jgi:hypothetical protein
MSNTVAIRRENGTEAMTISGLVELSQEVGKHGADIQKLKEETGKLDRLEKEVDAVATETTLIRQELRQLNNNDERIEKAVQDMTVNTSRFRYTLWTVVVLIFGCIFGTLKFGIDLTEKNQATHNKNLQKQISDNNKRNIENYKDISLQIKELRKDINKQGK